MKTFVYLHLLVSMAFVCYGRRIFTLSEGEQRKQMSNEDVYDCSMADLEKLSSSAMSVMAENLGEIKKVMADPTFQKWAECITKQKQMKSAATNPDLKDQATRLAKYINSMMSEPDFVDQCNFQMAKRLVETQDVMGNELIGMLMSAQYLLEQERHLEMKAVMSDLNQEYHASPGIQNASHGVKDAATAETDFKSSSKVPDKAKRVAMWLLDGKTKLKANSKIQEKANDIAIRLLDAKTKIKANLKVPDEAKSIAILHVAESLFQLINVACEHADEKPRKKMEHFAEQVKLLIAEDAFPQEARNSEERMEKLMADPNIQKRVKRLAVLDPYSMTTQRLQSGTAYSASSPHSVPIPQTQRKQMSNEDLGDGGMAHLENTKRNSSAMSVVAENTTQIEKVMADVKFQKWVECISEQKQMKSLTSDPDLKDQATRLTEYVNSMMSQVDFVDQSTFRMARRVVETQHVMGTEQIGELMATQFLVDQAQHLEVMAMIADMTFQEEDAAIEFKALSPAPDMARGIAIWLSDAKRIATQALDAMTEIKANLKVPDKAKRVAILLMAGCLVHLIISACTRAHQRERETMEHLSKQLRKMIEHESTQEARYFEKRTEELMTDPNIKEQVKKITEEMRLFTLDPYSQKQVRRVDEEMKVMHANPNFKEWAKVVDEQMKGRIDFLSPAQRTQSCFTYSGSSPLL